MSVKDNTGIYIIESGILWTEMSQIRNIFVSIVALIIIYFFVRTANMMSAPPIFTMVAALMVVMIIWNVAKRLIRGY